MPDKAAALFEQAWRDATDDFEKFTAAHYVARHQPGTQGKLDWDLLSLELALKLDKPEVNVALPSLYLNIAKGYEDLGDIDHARIHYELAGSFAKYLDDDGYGRMVMTGIRTANDRLSVDQITPILNEDDLLTQAKID